MTVHPGKRASSDEDWLREPDQSELRPELWIDEHPEVQGMLAADCIKYYVDHVTMIDPFVSERLKPASYELTLGPYYRFEGQDRYLTRESPSLRIPPNSIVIVAMWERLLLPHYIAARFNLSIDLIYQGLLLGTGPQVDPGFKGVLSCPLHNISNNNIILTLKEPFAKIDFLKTTGIGRNVPCLMKEIKTEQILRERVAEIIGLEDNPCRLFKLGWRKPISGYGDRPVSSSVAANRRKFDGLNRRVTSEIKKFKKRDLYTLVGVVIGLMRLESPWTSAMAGYNSNT
ncbi:MAG: hypothetical protein HQ592_06170, partial [Planctomycetes bacterium]|nr:hypothetical protein [Planctomycetota bacterium]